MTISISGGHLTPALAFIDYVRSHHPDVSIEFIGRKYTQSNQSQHSRERQEIESREVTFHSLQVPKFNSRNPLRLIHDGLRYPMALLQALHILLKHRPSVFLSFGSYQAVPISLAAYILRIPIITHEQTRPGGAANKIISKIATKVAITFLDSSQAFPSSKVVLTGNPVRSELLKKQAKPSWFKAALDKPLIYITGGNQGSYLINSVVEQALPQLTHSYNVVHACGPSTSNADYKRSLQKAKRRLPSHRAKRYVVREWVKATELGWLYHHAACVVSRAGANTIGELILTRTPALLIPLPFAKNDEQHLNAKLLADAGCAVILPQKKLNPTSLVDTIATITSRSRARSTKAARLEYQENGSKNLYDLVVACST